MSRSRIRSSSRLSGGNMWRTRHPIPWFIFWLMAGHLSYAEETAPPQTGAAGAEEVKIEQIKQKYWAGGEEAQVGVVQNRTYSKAHKWSLGVEGGVAFND